MRSADRIDTLWHDLGGSSAETPRLRRRLVTGAALATLLGGLLAAVGLAEVVLVAAVYVAAELSVTLTMRALPRYAPNLRAPCSRYVKWTAARGRAGGARTLRVGKTVAGQMSGAAAHSSRLLGSASTAIRSRAPQLIAACANVAHAVIRQVAAGSTAAAVKIRPLAATTVQRLPRPAPPRPTDRSREALRLNASGAQLRRNGSFAQAAEQHRAALAILRELGDRRAVALTLNNLALALSREGNEIAAVEAFEEAAAILHELGDRQNEGQVIANLGLAHRRHGRREESNDVLELALTKLTPASTAYQTVEAELRRAS
jgi:Tetratricopeptide repeat